jgi:hypothetical protein
LRADQHLDPVHVIEVEIGVGRVVVETDVPKIFAHGRLGGAVEAAVGDPADEQLVAPVAQIGGGQNGSSRAMAPVPEAAFSASQPRSVAMTFTEPG